VKDAILFLLVLLAGSSKRLAKCWQRRTSLCLWNTTSFAYANYTISTYAWPVPNETSTADKNFTGGLAVSVVDAIAAPQGRLDGQVTMSTIAIVAKAFDSKLGSSN